MAIFESQPSAYTRFRVVAWEESTDAASNTSTVKFDFYFGRFKENGGSSGNSFMYATNLNVSFYLNGEWAAENSQQRIELPNGQWTWLASCTRTVYHNSDGSGSYAATASFTTTPSGVSPQSGSVWVSLPLTKLNRESILNSVEVLNVDDPAPSLSFNWTVYNADYSHKLTLRGTEDFYLTFSDLKGSAGTNTKSVSLTAWQRDQLFGHMKNKASFTARFDLETYYNGEKIGNTSSKEATVQVREEASRPEFKGFSSYDANDATVAVTTNDPIYIKGQSNLHVDIGEAKAKNGAAISHYRIKIGGTVKDFSEKAIPFGAIPVSGEQILTVEAVDSRGFSAKLEKTILVLDYQMPSILDYRIRREDEVGETAQVRFSGKISRLTLDEENINRVEAVSFRYAEAGGEWKDGGALAVESEGERFSFETAFFPKAGEQIAFDPEKQYRIEITVSDRLSSDTLLLVLNKGKPLVSFRERRIGINTNDPQDALDVRDGNIRMNGFCVQGFVGELDAETDLDDLTSGIYSQHLNANASEGKHYPVIAAGFLEVLENSYGYVVQRYTVYDGTAVYIRHRYQDQWGTWRSFCLN